MKNKCLIGYSLYFVLATVNFIMGAKDSGYYKTETIRTGVFEIDEKGKYEICELHAETPCMCHPETCSHFGGKTTKVTEIREYCG